MCIHLNLMIFTKIIRGFISATRPLITMSMGKSGGVSRVTGRLFGSAMTFGTVGQASAPGQIAIAKLREVMDMLS
ncbi:type I 3-dehydroquinate dehydratase [Klebsiella pneumoniae]|uniref:type I 3-dehydroquinate dehydratase n=1 Tax=Klebsiella pneumoniae TaxID=573 RepID=UPI00404608DC